MWWEFVLQDVSLGLVFGVALACSPRCCCRAARELTEGDPGPPAQRSTRSASRSRPTASPSLPPDGNGLIAVFVCAIMLGIRRPDLRASFEERAEDIIEIVKLGIFVVFGSLLTVDGLFGDGWAAVALVAVTLLVARPVAVWSRSPAPA